MHYDTAVMLLTTEPMNGSLQQALYNRVRANFPGTGLTFKYPVMGTTAGGSQAMYVRDDNGTIKGNYEDVTAVGIAVGGKLQMALLLNNTREPVEVQKQLNAMMSSAVLHGETGGTWDPLHLTSAVGGRSGLFFGATVQNQYAVGGMHLVASREYLVLLPTGQAYFGLPLDGHVLDLDFATACRQEPERCGTYKIENGIITFTERAEFGLINQFSLAFHSGCSRALHHRDISRNASL